MSYIYLASAYSHPDPFERERRYLQVLQATVELIQQDLYVYSPIVHFHLLARVANLPTTADFWRPKNEMMIKAASKVLILRTEGLDASIGVALEKKFAEINNIPVEYL